MSDDTVERKELIAEIQRRISYLLNTQDYTPEEKEAIARRFFQALEEEPKPLVHNPLGKK